MNMVMCMCVSMCAHVYMGMYVQVLQAPAPLVATLVHRRSVHAHIYLFDCKSVRLEEMVIMSAGKSHITLCYILKHSLQSVRLSAESSILMRPNDTFMQDALMTHQSVMVGHALRPLCLCVCVYVSVGLRTLLADTV